MIQEAKNKLRNEMVKENQEYINFIGEELIKVVSISEYAAAKIMSPGKSIIGSLKEMEKVAKRKARKGCAVMTDEEGMEIVYKYFEIEQLGNVKEKPLNNIVQLHPVPASVPQEKFEIDLDDLF